MSSNPLYGERQFSGVNTLVFPELVPGEITAGCFKRLLRVLEFHQWPYPEDVDYTREWNKIAQRILPQGCYAQHMNHQPWFCPGGDDDPPMIEVFQSNDYVVGRAGLVDDRFEIYMEP